MFATPVTLFRERTKQSQVINKKRRLGDEEKRTLKNSIKQKLRKIRNRKEQNGMVNKKYSSESKESSQRIDGKDLSSTC